MKAIEEKFKDLDVKNEGALIAYITCGDPTPQHTLMIADVLVKNGVDMLELGIPFSDPIADGPTIQRATFRALKSGTKPITVLNIAGEISSKHPNTPIIILTYYNIIYRMGLERFFTLAEENNVSGLIVPDLPIEEAMPCRIVAEKHKVDLILLAAPSTSDERLKKILEYTSGFLYLVSIFGVTGARRNLQKMSISFLRRVSAISNGRVRLAVGFGISKPSHVRTLIANGADGVIVGSRLIELIEKNIHMEDRMLLELGSYVRKLKKSTVKSLLDRT